MALDVVWCGLEWSHQWLQVPSSRWGGNQSPLRRHHHHHHHHHRQDMNNTWWNFFIHSFCSISWFGKDVVELSVCRSDWLQCIVFFFCCWTVVLAVPETHILIQFKAAWLVGCRYNFEGFFLNPCRALGSPLSWFLISSEFELTTIFNLSLSFSTNFHTTWATMEQLLKGVKKTKCLSTAHI